MPTAAKLVSAVLFALIAGLAAQAYSQTMPAQQARDWLVPILVLVGLWQGWMTMGGGVGRGTMAAMGMGLRTSVQIVFVAVFYFALFEMFFRSTRLRYDQPGEAIVGALELFMEYGWSVLMVSNCVAILILGGLIAGMMAELANRRWG